MQLVYANLDPDHHLVHVRLGRSIVGQDEEVPKLAQGSRGQVPIQAIGKHPQLETKVRRPFGP